MDERFDRLTATQRQCLRLVATGRTSKEIAIELKLSYHTVNRYLHAVTNAIGASNRREAAQRFAAWEASREYNKIACHSPGIAASQYRGMIAPPEPENVPQAGNAWASGQIIAMQSNLPMKSSGLLRAALPLGGRTNDLDAGRRIAAIFKLSLFSVIAASAILLIAMGAFKLFD